ncbi:hypothetical protein BGX34_004863 [Mortierella sp. NVP85]|nr:hypothetical protein BGX34_004863 [Mortierella sp. NVP85]
MSNPTSANPSAHPHQYHPRLNHSSSAGHLAPAGHRSAPIVVNTGGTPQAPKPGAGGAAPPKKKDPYATAWRTYSKIAEELNLANPDGSLYPISKEAILKYLHHQSKRIKSSNLHWYVNGLKKHQENLGLAWDDVRYDEQVVALLKELTLHPVSVDSGGSGGSASGGASSIPHSSNHHQTQPHPRHSMPIDTAKIAKLSISTNLYSQQQQQQQPYREPYRNQNQPLSPSFTVGSKRHPHQYEEPSSQAHSRQNPIYSERPQPASSHHGSRAAPFHSAPIPLPSALSQYSQDDGSAQGTPPQLHYKSHSAGGEGLSPTISTSATSSPMSSSEIQVIQQQSSPTSAGAMSNGVHVKRKRNELGPERMSRLASPTSAEGDELDEGDIHGRGTQGLNERDMEDMDEDHRERMALKRHASTGTLRVQAKVSAMSTMSSDQHLYQRQGDDLGEQYQHSRASSAATPSPAARENETGGHFRWGSSEASSLQSRLSPPGSTSPAIRNSHRHRRPNGVVSSPITVGLGGAISTSAVAGSSPAMPPPQSPSALLSSRKTTVQFSEVVEFAQQLQIKYGNKCRDHPWGCVELSEDVHLELTIKMYMDWAGLVASGRLSMDELPDLPEFKRPNGAHESPMSPTQGSAASGTLKRMISTPLTTSFSSSQQQRFQDPQSSNMNWSSLKSEDQGSFTFGRQHEPRSPTMSLGGQSPKEGYISDSLMSRLGSPPQRMIPSPPTTKYSPGSGHSSSKSSSRARKMASSPSLGQHASFQRFGFSPDRETPPVPALPPMLSLHQQRLEDRLSDVGSGINEPSYPRRSDEEMDLSGEDDRGPIEASMRSPRRRGSGEGEMDLDDDMYGREPYHRSLDSHRPRHNGHGRGIRSGHELEEDDDEREAFLMSSDVVPEKEGVRRKNPHVSRTSTRHYQRERYEYGHDNGDDNAAMNDEKEEDEDRLFVHQGRGRDLEDGRMRMKGAQPPLSSSSSSSKPLGTGRLHTFDDDPDTVNRNKNKFSVSEDEGANGPLKINEDPIEAAGMTMVPNLESRMRPSKQLWHLDESQCQDEGLDGESRTTKDSPMMEK